MAEPFAEDFPGMLHTQVYPMVSPHVAVALASMSQLADALRDAVAGTLQAVIDAQNQQPHEVAVAALLSGTATIMGTHRQRFHSIGTHMSATVTAISTAWTHYGQTGTWAIPEDLKPPLQPDPNTVITLSTPCPLVAGENIDHDYTEDFLGRVRNFGDRFATVSANTFTTFACHDLPIGELSDAIDITNVEHTGAVAHTATTMRKHLHYLTDTINTSHRQYQETGLWAAPAVALPSSP